MDILKRLQKLELMTNRMIVQSGQLGQSLGSYEPTPHERSSKLQQDIALRQMAERIDLIDNTIGSTVGRISQLERSALEKPTQEQTAAQKVMATVKTEDLDAPIDPKTKKAGSKKERPEPLRPTSVARSDKSGSFYDMEFSPSHTKKEAKLSDDPKNFLMPADNVVFEF